MTKGFPDRITALQIWSGGIEHYLQKPQVTSQAIKEYIFHTSGIAHACETIARAAGLDADKAFAIGLLHDYGKYDDEAHGGDFHCRVGYNDMLKMGYPEVARICITHYFPNPNFPDSDYKFSQDWKNWAHSFLKDMIYDDYDRLAQFVDLLFEGMEITTLLKRHQGIVHRYKLNWSDVQNSYDNAVKNKARFDELCGTDTYRLLNIKEV